MNNTLLREYNILYKKVLYYDCIPKHLIPTKEDWLKDKDIYLLKYYYYLEHSKNQDKMIQKILIKNPFIKYLTFLKNHI